MEMRNGAQFGDEESLNIPAIPSMESYSQNISGLLPFASYRISVRAYTSVGPGSPLVINVDTDPDSASPPTSFMITEITAMSITLSWGYPMNPHGQIVGYVLRVGTSADFDGGIPDVNFTLPVLDDTGAQMRVVGGLDPFTRYFFAVRAFSFGEDPFVVHSGLESAAISEVTAEAGN